MGLTYLTKTKIKDALQIDSVINPNGIRRKNEAYLVMWIFYYVWVVAFTTWWMALPVVNSVFDVQIRNIMQTVNIFSSVMFAFIIRKEWCLKALRIGLVLTILSMVLFFIFESEKLRLLLAITGSIVMGCVNICILIRFVFTLNNTEKLYAVVCSNVLTQLICLINEHNLSNLVTIIMSFTLLMCSLSTVLFFKK